MLSHEERLMGINGEERERGNLRSHPFFCFVCVRLEERCISLALHCDSTLQYQFYLCKLVFAN